MDRGFAGEPGMIEKDYRRSYGHVRIASFEGDTFEYVLAKVDPFTIFGFQNWVEVLPTSASGPLKYTVLPNGRSGTIHQEPALVEGSLCNSTATQPYFILVKSSYFVSASKTAMKTCWLAISNLVTTP